MNRSPHILNASSNLLGITLLIIAGLHLTDKAAQSFADEIAWIGAICFLASCFVSFLAISDGKSRLEPWADRIFLLGLTTLFVSIVVMALPGGLGH
jgi:NADH:ubiquinone oxidoreductase subunit 6 (subunit J)